MVKQRVVEYLTMKLGGGTMQLMILSQAALCMMLNSKPSQNVFKTNTNNDQNKIFKIAWAIQDTNKDVTRENCVCDDDRNLTISDEAKLHAWKEDYQRLLNVEFPWDKNSLNNSVVVEGTPTFVTENFMTEVIKKMKLRKAGGPSGVIVEMIKAGRRETGTAISELVNLIMFEENITEDWKDSFIKNCYKRKGDATDRGNYRGCKLLENVI